MISRDMGEIVNNFGGFYRELTSDRQLCWTGPEKGAVHLAIAAVPNALSAKQEEKFLWKLLVDIPDLKLSSSASEEQMWKHGYLAYTRSCAWLGYSEQLKQMQFKVKVGADLQDDICRCRFIRETIDPDKIIALAPLGVGVATREQCHNRVILKQLLTAKALSYLQIDSCRLGSVNENLSVLLMAKKFQIFLWYGLGGLCEFVQHLIIFDYIPVSGSLESSLRRKVCFLHPSDLLSSINLLGLQGTNFISTTAIGSKLC
ncbi:LOW QUALITY PROTEIN: mitochondrial enolase superfamily member 1 [Theristicus caerulescens]